MILWLIACSVENCEDAPRYEEWTEGFFLSRCMPCHSQDAHEHFGAPYIELGDHQVVLDNIDMIRKSVVEDARMPPAGGLTAEEKDLIESWFMCPQ